MSKNLGDFTLGEWFNIFLKAWPAFLLVQLVVLLVVTLVSIVILIPFWLVAGR